MLCVALGGGLVVGPYGRSAGGGVSLCSGMLAVVWLDALVGGLWWMREQLTGPVVGPVGVVFCCPWPGLVWLLVVLLLLAGAQRRFAFVGCCVLSLVGV